MALMAEKKGKDFELPTEGTVQAVIAEVRDLGIVAGSYKGKPTSSHKVLLRWQLAELDSEKQPKRIYERFTLSLGTEANLRKRIKGLFGKEPPDSFDVEKLVGTNSNIVVVHAPSKDGSKTYANIAATLKLQPTQKKLEIVAIPKKDEVKAEVAKSLAVTEANPITDDDIPF